MVIKTQRKSSCFHCGDECHTNDIIWDDKVFCCDGCRTVHMILDNGGLADYYSFNEHPGIKRNRPSSDFSWLDNEEILTTLIRFREGHVVNLQLHIPAIHCSSCVWLLENLDQLNAGVRSVRVNFLQKTAAISLNISEITIRELAELLSAIGYEPRITLDAEDQKQLAGKSNRRLLLQLAVAGFCFGNVMLFSFPEYFGLSKVYEGGFARLFATLNLALSIPALIYSGRDYLVSAWKSVLSKNLHINVPLAIGMVALFGRTSYEILTGIGPGYADSLTGLIFFLLVGKWFQQKTYDSLSFERDYRAYFPLAVTCIQNGNTTTKPLSRVTEGDRLVIRSGELIPVDGILLRGRGVIDYSFVTGESVPVNKSLGEIVYAGGRQTEERIEVEAIKAVEQSHLTSLWNAGGKDKSSGITYFSDKAGRVFTKALLGIAAVTFIAWSFFDLSMAFFAVTSVLIVACPCALALSSPFALGNAMRILGRAGLYLKNYQVVEDMAHVDHIVFDKTGTLTEAGRLEIDYIGDDLNNHQIELAKGLVANSNHPYSRGLYAHWPEHHSHPLDEVSEIPGKGLQGRFGSEELKIGSADFVFGRPGSQGSVHLQFSNGTSGSFMMRNKYRRYVPDLTAILQKENFEMTVLSGDSHAELDRIRQHTTGIDRYLFRMDPLDKKYVIHQIQEQGKAMMIGDGLNDAGALKEAHVGIVLTEDTNNFTPAAKAILVEDAFIKLPSMIRFSKSTLNVIRWSLVFSLLYNTAGLIFAVQGLLSPVVAAILMPASSITVVALNTLSTTLLGRKEGLI